MSKRMISRLLLVTTVGLLTIPVLAAAADEAPGQTLFVAQKCNTCHSVEKVGIEAKMKNPKMMGPDLTKVGEQHDAEWIQKFVKKEVQLHDKAHKATFKGTDEELQTIATWLVSLK